MNPSSDTLSSLFPPIPAPDTRYLTRRLKGKRASTPFTCGGAFTTAPESASGMAATDLRKIVAVSNDHDLCDDPITRAALGVEGRDEAKTMLRGMEQADVEALSRSVRFVERVLQTMTGLGFPIRPNLLLATGHGYVTVYWVEADIGWSDRGQLRASEMQRIWKATVAGLDSPLIDSGAKDLGTRLFPVPGYPHRDASKLVRLLEWSEDIVPLRPVFEALRRRFGTAAASPKRSSSSPRTSRPGSGGAFDIEYRNPYLHPYLPPGGRGGCPSCGSNTSYRRIDDHHTCFRCNTVFRESGLELPDVEVVEVPLNERGHAEFPSETPRRLLLSARTGSGKTHLMKEITKRYAVERHNEVRAVHYVSPIRSLVQTGADALDIRALLEPSERTPRGSCAYCFAALATRAESMTPEQIGRLYFFFDEIEQQLGQLYGMLDGERGRDTYSKLLYVLSSCYGYVLADAHIGPNTAQLVRDLRNYRAARGMERAEPVRWTTAPHSWTFREVRPLARVNGKGETVITSSSTAQHEGLIIRRVGEGLRLAVFIPSRDGCRALARAARTIYPDKRVVCITRQDSYEDGENDFSDEGLTADLLIYNTAMGTGVSYNPRHYDERHVMLKSGGFANGQTVEQAVHRVRNPKDPVVTISGQDRAIITDWRCSPREQLQTALRRFKEADALNQSIAPGVKLGSSYHIDPWTRRLNELQAVVIASQYAKGFNGVLEWLRGVHTFEATGGVADEAASELVKERREEVERERYSGIANAIPVSDERADELEGTTPETQAEYYGYRANRIGQVFGEAFHGAARAEKRRIAEETEKKKLGERARTFALARLLYSSDPEARAAAARAEARSNASRTHVTARLLLGRARLLAALLRELAELPREAGRIEVAPERALEVCRRLRSLYYAARVTARADLDSAPLRQLAELLRLGGLKMESRLSGPRGRRRRLYWLDVSQIERMKGLSEHLYQRWTAREEETP